MSLFGKTLETVLSERPCRVIIESTRGTGEGRKPPEQGYDGAVQRAYAASTRALSVLMLLLGVAMVVSTLSRGGGALALGVVLGALLALIGAAGSGWHAPSAGSGRP